MGLLSINEGSWGDSGSDFSDSGMDPECTGYVHQFLWCA